MRHQLILAALLALPLATQAQEGFAPERAFLLDTLATYDDNTASISDSAKQECGLERLIPQAALKFAPKYKVQLSLNDRPAGAAPDAATRVALRITTLVGGRAGSGFGGRWVESEAGISALVTQGEQKIADTKFSCKAGLGANPFANFKACDRLERCADQLGAKTARWLRTVATSKPGGAPTPAPEDTASSPAPGASE